jgi:uncharacterized protein (UPF0248 family)
MSILYKDEGTKERKREDRTKIVKNLLVIVHMKKETQILVLTLRAVEIPNTYRSKDK